MHPYVREEAPRERKSLLETDTSALEKAVAQLRRSLSSSKDGVRLCRNWHRDHIRVGCERVCGCRGFAGPDPSTSLDKSVIHGIFS
jgi:hypothetical protein